MAATLTQVRAALAATIKDNVDRQVYTYSVIKENGPLPAVIVEPDSTDFTVSMRSGTDTWNFFVWVLTPANDIETGQTMLDDFLDGQGPNSIRQAIYKHSDLGLSGVEAFVSGMRGYGGAFEWYGVPHVGALLQVGVHISG